MRWFALAAFAAAFGPLAGSVSAAPPAPATPIAAEAATAPWEVARNTSPETVDELKSLQERVKATTSKVMPATVGLIVGMGAGSGVIVSDDGIVLTAAHVIGRPGAKMTIVLSDGSTVPGEALGLNDKLDSGMAKITGKVPKGATWKGAADGKWPAAELGKADTLKKGQWVISLGHHGGPRKERTPPLRVGRFENYAKNEMVLRSDCTLVGGDSGGPLFDLDGKVVGIHSKIGFLIDANMHVPVEAFQKEWEQLREGVQVGKAVATFGAELDAKLETPTVLKVDEDSPADKGGLKVGDVVTKFGGDRIQTRDDLKDLLKATRPGESINVEVKRDGKVVKLKITLGSKGGGRKKSDEDE